DTLGRSVVSWSGIGNLTSGDNLTISGLPSNIVVKWANKTAYLPNTRYAVPGATGCGIGSSPNTSASVRVVTEIDLPGQPSAQKYISSYGGPWGRLTQITFPGAGYV